MVEQIPTSPVKKINFKRLGIILGTLLILVSIFITVYLVKQKQEVRKKAVVVPSEVTTLFFPLFFKNYNEIISSAVVQNIGEEATDITLTFYDFNDGMAGEITENDFPAKGFKTFDASLLSQISNGFLGSVVVESTASEIVGTVDASRRGDGLSALSYSYSGFSPPPNGGKRVFLPWYPKNYDQTVGSFAVQNIGETTTDITAYFYDENGNERLSKTESDVLPKLTRIFYNLPELPDNSISSVVVESTVSDIAVVCSTERRE